jgi:hypothetical protein
MEPYLDRCGHATRNSGISFVDPARLPAYVAELDAQGFQVHVHGIGDRGVHEALDAFEGTDPARRHHIAHLQLIEPDDIPRFHALGVAANLQALLLPSVVRFARLPVDTSVDEEFRFADQYTLDAAIDALDTTAEELGSGPKVVDRVRHELGKQRRLVTAEGDGDPVVQHDDQYTSLSLALIGRRREALLELRDEQRIDDIVLRQVQARLDIEEVRLLRASPLE